VKKNVLLLLFLLSFLTGCTVEYDLEFDGYKFKEDVKIGPFDSNKVADFEYLTPYSIYNNDYQEFYDMDYSNDYLNLQYTYDFNKYKMAESLSSCYDTYSISYDEDYYYILTSNEFKCLSYEGYNINEIKINFKTSYEVVEINSNYVDNGVYTWIVNAGNSKSSPINIKLKREALEENINETEENNNSFDIIQYIVLVGVLGVLILIVYLYIRKKSKETNEL